MVGHGKDPLFSPFFGLPCGLQWRGTNGIMYFGMVSCREKPDRCGGKRKRHTGAPHGPPGLRDTTVEKKRIDILGVGFDPVTPDEALARLEEMTERGEGGYVVTPNPEIVYACRKDPSLLPLAEEAALVVPDGIGVVYAARILKRPLPGRVPGIELGERFAAYLAETGKRLYLLGAKPGIAEKAAAELQRRCPGLVIAGTADGYYRDEAAAAAALRDAAPDAAFVCMGFPRQEKFMAAHAAQVPRCVMLGLGGSLDVFAGEVKRAPKIFIRLGLEWFYRLLREPRRLGRMMKLPAFLWLALRERVTGGKHG